MGSEHTGSGRGAAQAENSYEFVRAPRDLGARVPSTTGYRSSNAGAGTHLHRGLPSPYLTLVFSLDDPVVSGTSAEQARGSDAYRSHIVAGGLHQSPAYILQPPHETGVQLAVHPLASRALLGLPASELTQLTGDGGDILGARATELRERMCEQRSWEERFATLAEYLRRRVADAESQPGVRAGVRPEVAEAWRWLARHRGNGSMDGLARHVALSTRQLTTVFQREVGLSPKQISRLMRFERARQAIAGAVAGGRPLDLARVAAQCGYYDHSHLVRDFRQYAGLSPSGWIAEEHRNIQAAGQHDGEEWDT